MVETRAFLQIQTINIMYPNEENMIVVPITKIMEIIMSIQVCLISQMNINYKKSMEKMIATLVRKRMEVITSIQVCLIS